MSKDAIPLPDDITIAVNARLFQAVAQFRAVADIRWYLNGVYVMPSPVGPGAYIAATNGHQLAIALDIEGRAPEGLILAVSNGLVSAARANRHKTGSHVVVQDGRIRVLSSLLEERYVQPGPVFVEGAKYPDVLATLRPMLGEMTPGMAGLFQPQYIERLTKVSKDLSIRTASPLLHWQTVDRVLYTRFAAEPELLVVTMPLRDESTDIATHAPLLLRNAVAQRRDYLAAKEAEAKSAALADKAETSVNADAQPA